MHGKIDKSNQINTYKNLIVWQKGIDLVVNLYELTEQFPKEELYGLTIQMKKPATSIPSNIADGLRGSQIRNLLSSFIIR